MPTLNATAPARQHGIDAAAVRRGLQLWADRGYQGDAPTLITPVRAGKDKPLIPGGRCA